MFGHAGVTKTQMDSAEQANPNTADNFTLLRKAKTRLLLLFDELPDWAKDNEYILSGWGPETNSYWECIKSMGYVHNESGTPTRMTASSFPSSSWVA
ncbi:hypothetical protein J3459_010635 [Metarhizium acridum]|uniref:uncharacterized protein n=1 Tax=Metarhizium acridum TaxID=92637 RepID=UPI001C6D2076|nr:hypothetical protein J3458_020971 [Metarhizium acridum]KAG8422147.1 hypothetical protein J3459_010635 [Metarhizium acridum]